MKATVVACALTLLVAVMPAAATAVDYPSRTISIIVPIGPGSAIDAIVRVIVPHLTQRLGRSVIVESKPGAGMALGAQFTANSAPDGHTIMVAPTGVFAINPTFFKKLSYDPARDFIPVALFAENAFVLVVNPGLPVRSLDELAALGKSGKQSLSYAGSSLGGLVYLTGELLRKKVDMVMVPYAQGSAAALNDVVAGHASLMFADMSQAPSLIQSGALRALAVSSPRRQKALPDVPTVAELGMPELTATSWTLLVVPAGTPSAIVESLRAEIVSIVALPEVQAAFERLGFEAVDSPPIQELRRFIAEEKARWGDVVIAAGLAGKE